MTRTEKILFNMLHAMSSALFDAAEAIKLQGDAATPETTSAVDVSYAEPPVILPAPAAMAASYKEMMATAHAAIDEATKAVDTVTIRPLAVTDDARILAAVRAANGSGIAANVVADQLTMDRVAVSKALKKMVATGQVTMTGIKRGARYHEVKESAQ